MNLRMTLSIGLAATMLVSGPRPTHAQDYAQPRTRQVCHNVRVQDRPSDQHQIAGTAVGAVAGGLLGHQVGGGKGKTLATVGGAVVGGYAGKKVQENHQENHASYHIERRCHEVRG